MKVDSRQERARAGDWIELDGATTQTDFAPDIVNAHWQVLGRAPMPVTERIEFGRLISTEEDSRWVAIEGIVRAAVMVHRAWSASKFFSRG